MQPKKLPDIAKIFTVLNGKIVFSRKINENTLLINFNLPVFILLNMLKYNLGIFKLVEVNTIKPDYYLPVSLTEEDEHAYAVVCKDGQYALRDELPNVYHTYPLASFVSWVQEVDIDRLINFINKFNTPQKATLLDNDLAEVAQTLQQLLEYLGEAEEVTSDEDASE